MAVGVFGPRTNAKACLTSQGGLAPGDPFVMAGVDNGVQLGADAWDTLVVDTHGFATGHGLADGQFVIPAGLGGLYRVTLWATDYGPIAAGTQHSELGINVFGGGFAIPNDVYVGGEVTDTAADVVALRDTVLTLGFSDIVVRLADGNRLQADWIARSPGINGNHFVFGETFLIERIGN